MELYRLMLSRGYPEGFCDAVTRNLNTDYTARRMIGYFSHMKHPSMEEVADEMLAIQSDRDRIRDKHITEHAQAKINDLYRNLNE